VTGQDLVGTVLELTVGPVAHGGHCVARADGRVVFVRHALPGERVRARVTEGASTSRFLRADAVAVLEAAADRVDPPCPFAGPGRCGGCDWQHVSLAGQRRLKAEVVAQAMSRFAGVDRRVEVEPVHGDEAGLGWRTRVHYAVDAEGRVGLRAHRSHEVVPLDVCRIAHPEVTATGVTRVRWPGTLGLDVVGTPGGERGLVWHPGPGVRPTGLPALPGAPLAGALMVTGATRTRLAGRGWVRQEAAGRSWRVSLDSFWQVHPGAADTLVDAVRRGLRARPGERVADLYAGVGLFAGALAADVGPTGHVLAVEADARAVADARRNLHDVPAVALREGRVDRVDLGDVDLVVLDPPRSGAGRAVVADIARATPRAVAYVACDPVALARDVATFAGHGYQLSGLRAFDLFPMTGHVECVAVLTPVAGAGACHDRDALS
jgi:tRNA/tmRNA/rRNA uracil-C5-methylase (TrmA/RlmC/RlmD family)